MECIFEKFVRRPDPQYAATNTATVAWNQCVGFVRLPMFERNYVRVIQFFPPRKISCMSL